MAKLDYLYFRHRLDAHRDPKILELRERGGNEALGVWWILLEVYGEAVYQKDDQSFCEIHTKILQRSTGKNSKGLLTLLRLLEELYLLSFKNLGTFFQLSIPNYPKYFGSYGGTLEQKESKGVLSKSKSKSKKEKINKKETAAPSREGLDFLLKEINLSPEIQSKLKNLTGTMASKWVSDYNLESLRSNIDEAYQYSVDSPRKYKSFTSFCNNWLKRSCEPRVDSATEVMLELQSLRESMPDAY